MSAFSKYVRSTLEQAGQEAQLDRATTIEAQHVLLAIAAQPELPAAQVLKSVGLDRRAIRDALDREFEHSLRAAGVSLEAFALPPPASAPEPATQLGASVKNALERGVTGVRKSKDLQPSHLLLGILLAEVGTVPRALALARIDRADLMLRLRQTLADKGKS
jgi:ATP-dependent Clp protease ATP-binding subunit ClpA